MQLAKKSIHQNNSFTNDGVIVNFNNISFQIFDKDIAPVGVHLLAMDKNGNTYWAYRTYARDSKINRKPFDINIAIVNNQWQFCGKVRLVYSSAYIDNAPGPAGYIYVDPYFGNIYQLNIRDDGATLIKWISVKEEKE